ncbi:PCYCGC motif-containing (lipo)protein [Cohnella lubricantis]|uniref:Lipoprotein n=1 Tax=Cohnella lubricantis TaxID=2163172 RepID=A0A841TBT3_9BACL|nr:PCYCGC motif-containing (lipo)protein [Cohnella lubricantis]MBB6677586.1 hypothetical protein [Cohnella lubricantis]MBP2116527.1 hypothetical protein [Cohnella lubricantis]
MRKKLFWLLSGLALILVLAACGKASDNENETASAIQMQPNGDLQEKTASTSVMPAFLSEESETVRLAYTAAAKLMDTLQFIPCYCGCGLSAGHRSNLDCFIAGVREDGAVIWDDHGTGCGVCQQIALQAAKLKQEGRSDLEIRQFVDETYGEGYAAPTDTPMPNA